MEPDSRSLIIGYVAVAGIWFSEEALPHLPNICLYQINHKKLRKLTNICKKCVKYILEQGKAIIYLLKLITKGVQATQIPRIDI